MIQQFHSWAYIQKTSVIRKDTSIPMYIAALFRIAKTWKQSKCLGTDKDVVYKYNGILLSHEKE